MDGTQTTRANTTTNFPGLVPIRAQCDGLGLTISKRLTSLHATDDGYRFINDIVPEISLQGTIDIVQRIKTRKGQGNTIAIVYHEESKDIGHAHIYHRCLYHASHCRCTFIRGLATKRRRSRYTPLFRSVFNAEYWSRWLFYFSTQPRRTIHLQIAGMDFSAQVHRIERLRQSGRAIEDQEDRVVEDVNTSCESLTWDLVESSSTDTDNHQLVRKVNRVVSGRIEKQPRFGSKICSSIKQSIYSYILTKLETLLCIPIESSCETQEWLSDSSLLFVNKSDPEYKKACSAFNRKTHFLKYDEILSYHTNPLAIGLYFQRSDRHYYSLTTSLQFCEKLLFHQFETEDKVISFLTILWQIAEKQLPKKNTLMIVGPPNSGKSWFFDMISSFYLNIGHVKNFNRNSSFPLNDCVQRRVLMWNEPNIAPSEFDTVKMLAGGDPCACAIKYEGDGKVTRTPLFITSNKQIFPVNDPVWSTRIAFYTWRSCPLLAEAEFYPHPLTYKLLLEKYVF